MVTVLFSPLWFTMVTAYPWLAKRTRSGMGRTVLSFTDSATAPFPAAVRFRTGAPTTEISAGSVVLMTPCVIIPSGSVIASR